LDAGIVKPCPGRTNGLPGRRSSSFDEGLPGRKSRKSSRVTSLAIRSGWAGKSKHRPSGLAGACLHPSKTDRTAKARSTGQCSNGFAPRAGGTVKRQLDRATSIAHRPASSSSQPQGRLPHRKEGLEREFGMAQRVHEAPVVCRSRSEASCSLRASRRKERSRLPGTDRFAGTCRQTRHRKVTSGVG
jgi:hypothetical protein